MFFNLFFNMFAFLGLLGAILAQHGRQNVFNCLQNAFKMPTKASSITPNDSKRVPQSFQAASNGRPQMYTPKSFQDASVPVNLGWSGGTSA